MKSAMPATPVQLALPLELQLGVLTTSFRETLTQRLPPLAIPWPPKKQPAPWGAGGGPNRAGHRMERGLTSQGATGRGEAGEGGKG